MEENTHKLGVVENRMPPWNVGGKGRCCQLVLMLQKGKDVDQP